MTSAPAISCHACGTPLAAERIARRERLVASDCQPVTAPLDLAQCPACGLAQKAATPAWEAACAAIYADYRIYHQAAGKEQKARSITSGTFAPRSELLVEFLGSAAGLGRRGAVLDVGCGNGAFLRAFHDGQPGWAINGAELNPTFRADIEAVAPGARFVPSGDLGALDERFDLVTLIHCLEHIPAPGAYLAGLKQLLAPGGHLMIEVPDGELNPFDLMIADHASHFSKTALAGIVAAAGYEVVAAGNLVLGKEITVLARPLAGGASAASGTQPDAAPPAFLARNLAWIEALKAQALALARSGPIGVFGSSIAASWLAGELGERLAFFVDEDPDRAGGTHLGRPILAPAAVSRGATVLLALEPALAARIGERLVNHDFRAVLPAPVQ